MKKSDERLSKIIEVLGDIHFYPYDKDSFYFLTSEITGQMLSIKAKKVIFKRLLDLCNGNVTPTTISTLSIEDLRSIGLSKAKSRYIKDLAEKILENKIDFNQLAILPDDEVLKELKKLEGIGNWTAKMYLIFYLQRQDILPFEDGAFLQAYKWLYDSPNAIPEEIKKVCANWKPYTSIGVRYMYKALDEGLTKIPITEFLNLKIEDN